MIIKDLSYFEELDRQKVRGGGKHGYGDIFADFSISKILEQYSDLFNISITIDKNIFGVEGKDPKTSKAKKSEASPVKAEMLEKSGSGSMRSTSSSTDKFPR